MESSQSVVRLVDVRKFLGDTQSGFELRVPELSIARGSFVAITGKSGSGKSTLLDVLALIAEPTSSSMFRLQLSKKREDSVDVGRLWSAGDDQAISELRRYHMGYVLQTGALLNFLNVRDNVSLPLRMSGRPNNKKLSAAIERALVHFGIPQSRLQDTRSLSGGERQRVAILRAILHRPAIVFCDEPTAALDFNMAQIVLKQLRDLAEQFSTTVVVVTHDVELVSPFATQRVVFAADRKASTSERRVFNALEAG